MVEFEENVKQYTSMRTLMLASILSALGFVVALFWNDAIKSAIEIFFPARDTVGAKFIAAIIVTIIVFIMVYILYRGQKIAEKQLKDITTQIQKHAIKGRKYKQET